MAEPFDLRKYLQDQIDGKASMADVNTAIAELLNNAGGSSTVLLKSPSSWSNVKSVATLQNLRDMQDFIANPPADLATFRVLPIPAPTVTPGQPFTVTIKVRMYAPLDNANLTYFCRLYKQDNSTHKHATGVMSDGTFDGDVWSVPVTFTAADTTGLSGNWYIGVKFYRNLTSSFPAYTPVTRAAGVVAGAAADEHRITDYFTIGAGGEEGEPPPAVDDKLVFYGNFQLMAGIPTTGGNYSPNLMQRIATALNGSYQVVSEARSTSTLAQLIAGTDATTDPVAAAHPVLASQVSGSDAEYVFCSFFGTVEQWTGQTAPMITQYKADLTTWATAWRGGGKKVCFITPPPNLSGGNIKLYADAMKEAAAAMSPAVPVIDLWQYITTLLGTSAVTTRLPDGVNFNSDTLQLVAEHIATRFAAIYGGGSVVVTPPSVDLVKRPFPGGPHTKTLAELGATYEAANSPATQAMRNWPDSTKSANKNQWTQTVYEATVSDSQINVHVSAQYIVPGASPATWFPGTITTYWNSSMLPDPGNVNGTVPNPLQQPNRQFDGHIMIVQPDKQWIVELWQFQRTDGVNFTAVSGLKHPLARTTETGKWRGYGYGISGLKLTAPPPVGIGSPTELNQGEYNNNGGQGPFGWGAIRASGGSALPGLIRPGFQTDGINEALYMSFPDADASGDRTKGLLSKSGGNGGEGGTGPNGVPGRLSTGYWEPDPATRPDLNGWNTAGNWYMGSRLAIPPGTNINSLGLSAAGLVIARAMQVYGAIIQDASRGMVFNVDRRMPQAEKDTILASDIVKIINACVKVNIPGLVHQRIGM